MASKVKEIHQYDGTQWGPAVPIGADASNVDVRTSDNTDVPLQSVLGSFNATEPSIKTQINGKVDKEGGDVAHTVINDPVNQIPIYDLDTEETSEKLISDDISTDTDMVVMSGDGENLTTMWGKFNRFRKRVDNKFKNYLVTSLEGVAPGASSDTKGYSTQALNNYFNDVIGYTSAASVAQTGSVASQLSSLNSKTFKLGNYNPKLRAGLKNRDVTATYDYTVGCYAYYPEPLIVVFWLSLKVHIRESGEFCNFTLPPSFFPSGSGQSFTVSEISYLLDTTELAIKAQSEDDTYAVPEGRLMTGSGASRVKVKSAASITNPSLTGYWAWLKVSGVYLATIKN